ncbi:Zinc finger, CCHC-type [Cinara cedri]|uniref:Zinc finger, CCHC-type n=1 Tax=Cinara cedri TaxID=506608 RepID=A0A5E4N919_9HEMI|nr:Zinc finger, CCHC-type [Cinara cedri]
MGKNTLKEIWNSLLKTFERKEVASQLYLRRRLLKMKYSGAKLENEGIVCHLLLIMPETYNNVVTALKTLSPETLTIKFVKGRLLDEEVKKSNSITNEECLSDSVAFNAENTGKFHFKCYSCNQVGHKSAECSSNHLVNSERYFLSVKNKSEVLYFKKYEAVVSVHFRQRIQSILMTYIKNNNICPRQGFVDADFANEIDDRKSTSGYLYQVFGSTVS